MIVDQNAVKRFAEILKERGKSPATIESYSRDASRFLTYLQANGTSVEQVEPRTLVAYQSYLSHELEEKINSIRRTVIGIRQFFRFLVDTQNIDSTPFDLVAVPERDESLPASLGEDDVDALLLVAAAVTPTAKAERDLALITLLAFEGLKVGELIQLTWRDVIISERGGASSSVNLRITGPRSRSISLEAESTRRIIAWRDGTRASINQHATFKDRYVFTAFKGRGIVEGLTPMTRHGLKFILYDIGEKAGLKKLNAEQLRHFAVQKFVENGRPAEEIMQHLGLRRIGNVAKHIKKFQRDTTKEHIGESTGNDRSK